MNLSSNKKKPFLDKIVDFDIEKKYTKKIRFLCHISLWIFVWLLGLFSYLKSYNLLTANYFSIRNIICDTLSFYFFFYFIVKLLFNRNYIVLFVLGAYISIELWIISNFICIKTMDLFLSYNNKPLLMVVHSYAQTSFSYIISFQSLLIQLYVVFSFLSIPCFIKILFDITRYYSKSIKQERHSKSLEIDKLHLEKNFLSAQLNPHFLFNTFNNLYALALKKSTILPEVIEGLSDIMRYTVYDASADTVSLNDELNFIKNYIELERLRYSSDSSIELILSDNLPLNHKIAPLLIFPFVENAFKYGLKSKAKFLKVQVDYIDQMIVFLIENDTINYENANTQQYHGVGIANVQSRLKLLYPNNYLLTIKNTLNTFIVELKISI